MKPAIVPVALMILVALVSGCGQKNVVRPPAVVVQDTPQDVLWTLETCYRGQDLNGYSELLADDFQFYLEPGRRNQLDLAPAWDRTSEVGGTSGLFRVEDLEDIRIALRFGDPVQVNEVGREDWVSITVLDMFIEVDLKPMRGEPEGLTFRVDGDRQQFYFRKGKTPGDTDPKTADQYFLVEWRDFGAQFAASPTPVERTTWTSLKTMDY